MSDGQERARDETWGLDTEPITLVQSGEVLGSIFGMLDSATISSCSADGVCD